MANGLKKQYRPHNIGCGDGYDFWQISKLASSGCHFWGVDSSSKAIRTAQAESLFDERFEFLVKDVSQGLPFDDGKFEVIFSKNVLECIPDKLTLIEEIHRVLKNDGQIVIAHFDWDSQTIVRGRLAETGRLAYALCDLLRRGWQHEL
jgi:ubiquinone/menaquinone biosynthesis C-methylase UbiE